MSQHVINQILVVAALVATLSVVQVGCSFVESGDGAERLAGSWGLHALSHAGGIDVPPYVLENDSLYMIRFQTDGWVGVSRAFDVCNSCSAKYRIGPLGPVDASPNSLSISSGFGCTEMACSYDEFPAGHESHGDVLTRARSYKLIEVDGRTTLLIYFKDEQGVENHLEYRLFEEAE